MFFINVGIEANNQETNLILNIDNIENDNHDINILIEMIENSETLYNESIDCEIIDLTNINNVDLNFNFDIINKSLEELAEHIETQQSSNNNLLNLKDIFAYVINFYFHILFPYF